MAGSASNVRAGRAYVEIDATTSKLDKALSAAERKLKAFSGSVNKLGTAGVALAAGAAAPIAAATKAFASYEQALANLKAAASPTAAQLEQITTAIDRVSKSTGVGPTEVAAAFSELLKAGMPLSQVLDGAAESAIKFAKVGELQVGEAAVTMADALNVFGADGIKAADAVDIMSRAADASSISIQQVAQAFSMSSAVFGQNGQSLQDLTTAIAILGNAGVKGSDAGTSLKTMLLRLATGAETAGEVMDKLGISVRRADGSMKPMRDVIAELQTKMAGLDEVARADAMLKLFGSDAIRAGSILIRQGAAGWDQFAKSMTESKTVAEKYATVTDTLNGGASSTAAAVERLGIAFGRSFGPAVAGVIGDLSAVVERVTAWANTNDQLVRTLGEGAIKAALWAGGIGVGLVVVGKVADAVGTGVGAVRMLNAAMMGLAVNPVAIALGAVVALGYAIHRANSFAAEYHDTAAKALQAGNAQRAADLDRFDRLKQLADAERLNADQMKEAASIIKELEGRYGKLGLSINATTGKVLGLSDAQGKLNRAMKENALREARQAVAEAQNNYNQSRLAADAENKNNLANIGMLFSALAGDKSGALGKQNELQSRARSLEAAKRTLAALEGADAGDRNAITGGMYRPPAPPAAGKGKPGDPNELGADYWARKRAEAIEAAAKAAKDLGELDEREAAKRRSALAQELAEITKVAAERRELLGLLIAGERARGKDADRVKIANLEARRAAVAYQALKDAAAAAGDATARTAAQVAAAARDRLREMAQARVQTDSDLRLAERQQDVAEAQAAAEKAGGNDAAANERLRAAKLAMQQEQARQWRMQQLADARERLKGDPAALAEAEKRINDLADRMGNMPADDEQIKAASRGTFSGIAAGMLGGPAGRMAERTAKATEKTAALLEKTNDQLRRRRTLTFG